MAEKFILTLIDVRGVQKYIFSANELKQNLGASQLVELAVDRWVKQNLPEKHNVVGEAIYNIDPALKIEEGTLEAEVIYSGGGNVAIIFDSFDRAKSFTSAYTKTVLEYAPGLRVAVGHEPFEFEDKGLNIAWVKMFRKTLPSRKEGYTPTLPIAGLSVTAQCAFTGLPAIAEVADEDWEEGEEFRGVLVSAEVLAKQKAVQEANDRLSAMMPLKETFFEYPYRFDYLSSDEGKGNYIAVVHADGNNMGKRLKEYSDPEKCKDSRDMVDRLRNFSNSVRKQGQKAMKAVADAVNNLIKFEIDEETGKKRYYISHDLEQLSIGLVQEEGKVFVPIRPIVFGGDDITFVADGRLGVALAVKFLEAFDQGDFEDGKPGYACAGISIVHTSYPFAQAYSLAEDLAKDAKKEARETEEGRSMISWHISSSGLLLDWDAMETKYYTTQYGKLTARPWLVLPEGAPTWKTWKVFKQQIDDFRKDWKSRTKLKMLQSTLRDPRGVDAVKAFVDDFDKLPELHVAGFEQVPETGWFGGECVYYDALEANDLFFLME